MIKRKYRVCSSAHDFDRVDCPNFGRIWNDSYIEDDHLVTCALDGFDSHVNIEDYEEELVPDDCPCKLEHMLLDKDKIKELEHDTQK